MKSARSCWKLAELMNSPTPTWKRKLQRSKLLAERVNFELSDGIRAELGRDGIIVEITKDGVRWKRK